MADATGTLDIATFTYTNYKGVRSLRTVRPIRIVFASTAFYPLTGWLLEAFDLDRQATREFSLARIEGWKRRDDVEKV